ncbi:histidinol-phosphatase [compost metagenome]
MTVELNTSGLRSSRVGLYPAGPILAYCASRKIPVTLGSDAHHPRHVAGCLDEAVRLAEQAGLRQWSVFDRRKRETVPMVPFLALAER